MKQALLPPSSPAPERLSPKTHWDGVHRAERVNLAAAADRRADTRSLKATLKRLLGKRLEYIASYEEHLLWNVILPRHLPDVRGAKAIEIGSAPGEFLVRLARSRGCVPFGVDYSEEGVQVNRDLFVANGLDPGHVVCADVFSASFQQEHRESFDVVMSRGFIEHFSDPERIIGMHMSLLAPGGLLLVSIPNLRGANRALTWLCNRQILPLHNLDIMTLPAFEDLFTGEELESLFCGYYGTFNLHLFYAPDGSPARWLVGLAHRIQPALNVLFRSLLGNRGLESALFSPSLLFIGRKGANGRGDGIFP